MNIYVITFSVTLFDNIQKTSFYSSGDFKVSR